MFRSLLIALALTLGMTAQAKTINSVIAENFIRSLTSEVDTQGLNFKVGDQTAYSVDMSIIKGSMVMTVKSVAADEVVITQDMDLGFAGKQNCEQTINPNTGEIKKMVCNGQEQNQESPSYEIVDTKEDTITVPAGTFTCLYIKAKNTKDDSIAEQWVSPKQIPVFGMVKMLAPSQFGQVKVELKSFKKN